MVVTHSLPRMLDIWPALGLAEAQLGFVLAWTQALARLDPMWQYASMGRAVIPIVLGG